MKKILILMLALIMGMAGASYAVESLQGKVELGANFSFTNMDIDDVDDDTDLMIGLANVGYFITDGLQLGVAVVYTGVESGDTELTATQLNGQLKYHFNQPGWIVVPYAGAQGGIFNAEVESDDFSEDTDGGSYGAMAGIKIFVSESTTFNVELNYNHLSLDVDDVDDDLDADQTSLLLGLSTYF